MVLSTINDLCHNINFQESLIHPKDAICYPIDRSQVKPIIITDVAKTVKEGKSYIVLDSNETVLLEDLLHFESYANMEKGLLRDIFDLDSLQHHQLITSKFIKRIKIYTDKNSVSNDYIDILFSEPSPLQEADFESLNDIQKIDVVLELCKGKMGEQGTTCSLHSKLDQFSVFAGRNPLKVAQGIYTDTNIIKVA